MWSSILVIVGVLALSLSVSAVHQEIDCIDTKRRLRCVIKDNCPTRQLELSKNCPPGRICCRKHKTNPYLSLRTVPNRTVHPPEVKYRSDLDDERVVFPTENNYFKYETFISSTTVRTKNNVIESNRQSKSEDSMNLLSTNEFTNKIGRKSFAACQRYAKISIEYFHFMPLLPEVMPKKVAIDKCEPKINPLIVGGKNASIKNYPHMAALGYNRYESIDYLCGGTLISENFVLTAAHCASTRWGPPVEVHLGSSELYSNDAVKVAVTEAISHPKYKAPACYNDIALLRLNHSVKLTMFLRPACLPTPQSEAQSNTKVAVATGWGKTGFGRESSSTLLKVVLKIMGNQECSKYYKADTKTQALRNGITSDMLCASGYEEVHHDTCQGDSGGPLQTPLLDHDCMSQVIGITSFGKSCGAGIPAVYTKVLPYVSWIENIVW